MKSACAVRRLQAEQQLVSVPLCVMAVRLVLQTQRCFPAQHMLDTHARAHQPAWLPDSQSRLSAALTGPSYCPDRWCGADGRLGRPIASRQVETVNTQACRWRPARGLLWPSAVVWQAACKRLDGAKSPRAWFGFSFPAALLLFGLCSLVTVCWAPGLVSLSFFLFFYDMTSFYKPCGVSLSHPHSFHFCFL